MSVLIGKTEQQYITEIREPYQGYTVAIPRLGRPGEYLRKNFFGVRVTLDEHLAAAIQWRDEKYVELHGRHIPDRIFHKRQGNSNIEVVGVNKIVKTVKKKLKNGTIKVYSVPCIYAQIHTIPGKDYTRASGARSKLFSIAKYGEAEAIKLATAWRRQMEEQLIGIV
ncbi:MAG: hypothetical protein V4857_08940 [Pseudomonadota bacterium]